ncbi:MAG: hypothetical protein U0703_01005 [Anaerolineae bacterium]
MWRGASRRSRCASATATKSTCKRAFKIKGTPESHGSYAHLPSTMTVADVVAGGAEHYVENVRAWAQSAYDDLVRSGNLEAAHE